VTNPHHHIRVTDGMRKDLETWGSFLEQFNGTTMFLERDWDSDISLQLFTDASGGKGFGAYFQGEWAAAEWPGSWQDAGMLDDITFLEFFPILTATAIWGARLRNKKIVFRCDNEAVVGIINKQSSKSPRVMELVRPFVLLCLKNNILFRSKHVSGARNTICDSLSRGQFHKFRTLAPDSAESGQKIPEWLWKL
jgi:hypothetical protein